MSGAASDILEILFLMKVTNLVNFTESRSEVDIVPLFETIEDLRNCTLIMQTLLENKVYRKHSSWRRNSQEIMLGYRTARRTAVTSLRAGNCTRQKRVSHGYSRILTSK